MTDRCYKWMISATATDRVARIGVLDIPGGNYRPPINSGHCVNAPRDKTGDFSMRTSTFIVLSFLGLIGLAASLILLPRPNSQPTAPSNVPEFGNSVPATPDVEHIAEASTATGGNERAAADSVSGLVSVSAAAPVSVPVEAEEKAVNAEPDGQAALSLTPLQFPDWPKPKLVLVASGEQHGYFEPCGCTANQLGGMSRRGGLFEQLKSLGWDARGIDLGGISRRTGPQAQLKFETTLEALRELRYVGLGMGPEDLKLGTGYLLSQHLTDGDPPLTFLSANLIFFGSKELGTPLPFTIFEHDGLKVGVTCVISDTIRREVIPDRSAEDAAAADMQWIDPTAALKEVTQKFDEANVEFRVLLSHSTMDESRKLAQEFPTLDLVIAANGVTDGERQPEMIGPVRLLQVGKKGQQVGVIGIYPEDAEKPVRFELVTLRSEQFADSARMTELMQKYQDRLKDDSVITASEPVAHPSGATFVGANKCGECHTKAFEIWKATPHAHAFESLDPAQKREGYERLHGVLRTFDPECLSCHVTGWEPEEYVRFQSGFLNEQFASSGDDKLLQKLLAGSQCENCHGPGSRHIELIESDPAAAVRDVKITLQQAEEQTCVKCHDGDNSPDFKFEKYWDAVKHSGKD